MKKRWLIGIVLVVLVIIVTFYLYYKPEKCVDSDEFCIGKLDGVECSTGIWCDTFGRICGGNSCVGLGKGKCIDGKCISLDILRNIMRSGLSTCEGIYGKWREDFGCCCFDYCLSYREFMYLNITEEKKYSEENLECECCYKRWVDF